MQKRRRVVAAKRDRVHRPLPVAEDGVFAEAALEGTTTRDRDPERQRRGHPGRYFKVVLAASRNQQVIPVTAHDAIDLNHSGLAGCWSALREPLDSARLHSLTSLILRTCTYFTLTLLPCPTLSYITYSRCLLYFIASHAIFAYSLTRLRAYDLLTTYSNNTLKIPSTTLTTTYTHFASDLAAAVPLLLAGCEPKNTGTGEGGSSASRTVTAATRRGASETPRFEAMAVPGKQGRLDNKGWLRAVQARSAVLYLSPAWPLLPFPCLPRPYLSYLAPAVQRNACLTSSACDYYYLPTYLPTYPPTYLPTYLPTYNATRA